MHVCHVLYKGEESLNKGLGGLFSTYILIALHFKLRQSNSKQSQPDVAWN